MTPRKRGGQPGNTNALKHGFYSRTFRQTEIDDLETLLESGLDSEIAMMRIFTRRVFEMAQATDDLGEMADLLGVFGMAATRLGSLLKVQKMLGGDAREKTVQAINQAIAEVAEELCLSL